MTLSPKPPLKPRVSLTAFQYLCLKIATSPKQSSIWYLKQLNGYLEGTSSVISVHHFFFDGDALDPWSLSISYKDYFVNQNAGHHDQSSYTVTDKGMDVAKKAAVQIGLTLP